MALLLTAITSATAQKPRARELGITPLIGGTAGPLDAITDVAGVEVGHTTLISGSGKLVVGKGPIRTGVTVVHPRGRSSADPVFGAWFTLNGNGEMTGTTWLQESGILEGPIAITNTHSVGVVRDAILQWQVSRPGLQPWGLPVVAETWDGRLNDLNGFHVKPEHAIAALDGARGGAVPEGNVGGGTGMVCHGFKGGIGTASRKLTDAQGGYTVGVLVQCNFGARRELRVAGVPVGEEISDLLPCTATRDSTVLRGMSRCASSSAGGSTNEAADAGAGSIIIIVATDAPLLPHQLKRLATRAALGVGRSGGRGENSSGDIFVAFSTANPRISGDTGVARVAMLPNARINPLFSATVQATEEAILNAMLAADTMTGADDVRVFALPVDRLISALRKYGRAPIP
ncbi:MAG: P1 family peptidase [Gemmatimonadaceae bacterium]|nr:P1 family peptidase [Gemmatimonadaceae bacterium]NUP71351.1 P1 family peptidase [Gemmatimonadaceae bacterium]NUS33781.1 P1 family peptidase [Gemmatimonadaceae bacterium]